MKSQKITIIPGAYKYPFSFISLLFLSSFSSPPKFSASLSSGEDFSGKYFLFFLYSFTFVMSSSIPIEARLGSDESETSCGSSSSFRCPITRGRIGPSKGETSELSPHWKIRQPFAILTSDSEDAINESDRELAQSDFGDSDEEFHSMGVAGTVGDRDVSGLNAIGSDEQDPGDMDEQRGIIGAERIVSLETGQGTRSGGEPSRRIGGEQVVALDDEQNAREIPVGRPHSPTYAEYNARYDFE